MNVEGMPWYTDRGKGEKEEAGEGAKEVPEKQPEGTERLTWEESRYYTWGALKAALLVVGVMSLGLVAFVAFCVYVWFR